MLEQWRQPDCFFLAQWGIWYGPNGVEGDCATEVELGCGYYAVREFQNISGLIEDFDKDFPFLCTEITVKASNLRHAAALGVLKIAEQGGDESFVETLPTE